MEHEVRVLASKVRKSVKKWVAPNPAINHKKLSGACGIASYTLFLALRKKGYDPDLVCWVSPWGGHAWVELDGTVIDVTATQFSRKYRAIHIVPKVRYNVVDLSLGHVLLNRKAIRSIATWDRQSHLQYEVEVQGLLLQL